MEREERCRMELRVDYSVVVCCMDLKSKKRFKH